MSTKKHLRIDGELMARFKRRYPDHGDFSSVVTKLLRKHLAELDETNDLNPIPPATKEGTNG